MAKQKTLLQYGHVLSPAQFTVDSESASFCDSFSLPSVVFLLVILAHAPLFHGALWARFPPLFHPPPVFRDLLLLVHVVLLRSGRTACLASAFVFLLVSRMAAAAAPPLLLSPDLHMTPPLTAYSALFLFALFAFNLSHPWSFRCSKRWARQMSSYVVLRTPASRAASASLVIQLLDGLSHLMAGVLLGMSVLPRVIVELLLVLLHNLADPLFPALSISRDLNPFLAPLMFRVSQLLHDIADLFPVHAPQAAFFLFVSRTDAENHSFNSGVFVSRGVSDVSGLSL